MHSFTHVLTRPEDELMGWGGSFCCNKGGCIDAGKAEYCAPPQISVGVCKLMDYDSSRSSSLCELWRALIMAMRWALLDYNAPCVPRLQPMAYTTTPQQHLKQMTDYFEEV